MPELDAVIDRLTETLDRAMDIWSKGGWAMWAIAVIALAMFGMGLHILLSLTGKGFRSVPESTWRRWIEEPKERRGPIGRLIEILAGRESLKETDDVFRQLRLSECRPFERDLRVMKICVSAAPLVGLLGTVTGMLATFGALSSGGGGDKTMAMIASGISEALITTETGLVVALPGLFFQYQLTRQFERYKAFLAHLETVCNQKLHQRIREREKLRDAVVEAVAQRLREAVS